MPRPATYGIKKALSKLTRSVIPQPKVGRIPRDNQPIDARSYRTGIYVSGNSISSPDPAPYHLRCLIFAKIVASFCTRHERKIAVLSKVVFGIVSAS